MLNEELIEGYVKIKMAKIIGSWQMKVAKLYAEFNNDLNNLPQQSATVQDNVNKANQVHYPRNQLLAIIVMTALKEATKRAKVYISKDDRKGLLYVRDSKLEIQKKIGITTSTRVDRKEKEGEYQVFVEAPNVAFLETGRPIIVLESLPIGYSYNNITTLDKLILNLLKLDKVVYNELFF